MSEIEAIPSESPEVPDAASGPPPIDKALLDKLEACKLIEKTDAVIENSLVPGSAAEDILEVRRFLKGLHIPIYKECKEHPDFARATGPAPKAPKVETPTDVKAKAKAKQKRERKASRTRAN